MGTVEHTLISLLQLVRISGTYLVRPSGTQRDLKKKLCSILRSPNLDLLTVIHSG